MSKQDRIKSDGTHAIIQYVPTCHGLSSSRGIVFSLSDKSAGRMVIVVKSSMAIVGRKRGPLVGFLVVSKIFLILLFNMAPCKLLCHCS